VAVRCGVGFSVAKPSRACSGWSVIVPVPLIVLFAKVLTDIESEDTVVAIDQLHFPVRAVVVGCPAVHSLVHKDQTVGTAAVRKMDSTRFGLAAHIRFS
jgi:hypothetical protein